MLGGNPADTSGSTSLLYAGEQFDTDLQQYYLRARFYDPLNGRFNRTDPFAGSPQDPQSLHKYLYCHANPVNNIDPSGNFASASDVSASMGLRASLLIIQVVIWAIAARQLWKVFGPRGKRPTTEEQAAIDAARMVIKNNLVGKTFILSSAEEVNIIQEYADFNNYYVTDRGRQMGEHRPWPFERIVLNKRPTQRASSPTAIYEYVTDWFALTPEEGACFMVHELYHYFHWGIGYFEEKTAWELQAQVYIELGLVRDGDVWETIEIASRELGFPLP